MARTPLLAASLIAGVLSCRASDDAVLGRAQGALAWSYVASMTTGHAYGAAAVLGDGRVLVLSGYDGSGATSTVELFDPSTSTWSTAAALPAPVSRGAAVTTSATSILVVEGTTSVRWTGGAWVSTPPPPNGPRTNATLTRLADGRVLFAGGRKSGGGETSAAEIYDPSTDTWTSTGSMNLARQQHAAALLASGRVLVVGGVASSAPTEAAEWFDPSTGKWTTTGTMKVARRLASATTLASGRVLVAGGLPGISAVSSCESWDPTSGTFTLIGAMAIGRAGHEAIRLTDGRVLVGPTGAYDANAELFDPSTSTWSSAPTNVGRDSPVIAPLPGGRALLAGGYLPSGNSKTAEVFAPLAGANACTKGGECASGVCADGVCCDRACDGACEACNGTGTVGTCRPVTGAPPAHGGCGLVAKCVDGACATSCAADADCVSGHQCTGGTCAPTIADGESCTRDSQCKSGHCVDGVCCNEACTDTCRACDTSGKRGVCANVLGPPHGSRACTGSPLGPCGLQCDGTSPTTCSIAAVYTACSANACKDGVETHLSICDGSGKCNDVPKPCGSYACGDRGCKTYCTTSADCAAGNRCSAGACVALEGLGKPCTVDGDCASTHCADGVCCGVASCALGSTCGAAGAEGSCRKVDGQPCTADAECGSAHCVDGVCCGSACGGQCEACDVAGHFGKCYPVKGPPHGTRTACDAGTGCAARACDGKETTSCAGYVGSEVRCRDASCADGTLTAAAGCDGKGACLEKTTASCGGFACESGAALCKLRCAADSDCIGGYACKSGACAPKTPTCDDDGLAVVEPSGETKPCAPFVCRAGACLSACATSNDCVAGKTCDAIAGRCVDLAVEDAGGCSTGRSPRGVVGAWWLLALPFLRRRRAGLLAAALSLSCSPERAPEPLGTTRAALGAWTAIPSMNHARRLHVAVRLVSGKIAVIGGDGVVGPPPATAEIYDPIANTWTAFAGGPTGLGQAAVVALDDGRVLAIEWINGYGFLFDPTTGAWTSTTPNVRRGSGTLVKLADGRVLYAGGYTSAELTTAEVFDPKTNTWSTVGSMATPRRFAGGLLLPSGKAMIVGGGRGKAAEIFDPTPSTFASGPGMSSGYWDARWAQSSTGSLFVIGENDAFGWSSERFDPSTSTWTVGGALGKHGILAPIDSGWMLATGGVFGAPSSTAEAWNPTTNTWSAVSPLSLPRANAIGIGLGDGRVLVAGGDGTGGVVLSSAEVFERRHPADACVGDGDCRSGFCSEGVCCDRACKGACEACNVAGKVGTCTAIDGAPRAGHATCSPYLVCVSGACKATCGSDADCVSTHRCSGGVCVVKSANGAACTKASECTSGFCVDGVCCNRACDLQCETCNDFTPGTCAERYGAPKGSRPPCVGGDAECGMRCGGDPARCVAQLKGQACSANGCVDGIEQHASICDGLGFCGDVKKSCGAYACSTTTVGCATTCTTSAQCAKGYYCRDGACVPTFGLGKPCASADACGSGFCTDGVCCGESTCGAGRSCAGASRPGSCAKSNGTTCTTDVECGSGTCVDGVCCESRCDGQCEACDVTGHLGECFPVTGAVHGARTACKTDEANLCASTTCDGVRSDRCAGVPGEETLCRAGSCKDGVATRAARCDGKGGCPTVVLSPCLGFACDATTNDCKTSCAADADCTDGYACIEGRCERRAARCSDDFASVVALDGTTSSCAPYVCANGACKNRCGTTGDCAPGSVCDATSRTCGPAPAATDEGGCGFGSRGGGSSVVLLFVLVCATRRLRFSRAG